MKLSIARQGDVLIRQVKALPKNATEIQPTNGKIVLAWGEATGHHHRLELAECEAHEYTMAEAGEAVRRFLHVVGDNAAVKHEEHSAIPLPPGLYEIVIQREYSAEEIRSVAD